MSSIAICDEFPSMIGLLSASNSAASPTTYRTTSRETPCPIPILHAYASASRSSGPPMKNITILQFVSCNFLFNGTLTNMPPEFLQSLRLWIHIKGVLAVLIFIGNVSIPLLCISALDDPVCTRESIPWDECRENENIILATTEHGGHLAYYEGITANSMWWVRAVDEFLQVLHSSPLRNKRKMEGSNKHNLCESSIDQASFVNVMEDGMVTATTNSQDKGVEDASNNDNDLKTISSGERNDYTTEKLDSKFFVKHSSDQNVNDPTVPLRKYMGQLSGHGKISIWLLAYIAVATSWPLVGSALLLFFKKRFKNIIPATFLRR